MEKQRETTREVARDEHDALCELYEKIYGNGMFVKEFLWQPGAYGAAVGPIDQLVQALGLESADGVTEETIANLPPFIPFAMPGSGDTREAAVRDAYEQMKALQEKEAAVERGEVPSGTKYGEFTLGDAKVTAYLPDREPDEWRVTIERPDQPTVTETLRMNYAPVFGPDVSDVEALNQFIEELIVKYELE